MRSIFLATVLLKYSETICEKRPPAEELLTYCTCEDREDQTQNDTKP